MGTVEIFPALRDENDDLHPAPAFRADHRVHLIDLPDHCRPTLGRKAPELLLDDPERRCRCSRKISRRPSTMVISSLNLAKVQENLNLIGVFLEKLEKMAGYRNRLVHYYKEISNEEIYEILQNDLGDLEKFLKEIEKFLNKYRRIA
jgi:hypothetical protein